MYRTVTRNLRKRKLIDGTWYIETTTMYQPGEESVAELTYNEASLLKEGRKKKGRWRLLFDHRWGEVKDTSDEDLLRLALRESYGDAMAWMDEDGLVDEFYDSRNEIADSRRYFLNARTSAADAWIAEHEWVECKRPAAPSLQPGDFIALGFDGSIGGVHRSDATALCAVRISDMHVQLLGCWEKPEDGPDDWAPDREAVNAAVAHAMSTYVVAGMYADPPYWQPYLDLWTKEWGDKMQVVATRGKPMEWWTNRDRAASSALERFHTAVQDRLLGFTPWEDRDPESHEGQMIARLQRHVLNARRAPVRGGLLIRKEHPKSAARIDAAMAAVLAFECASDAVAQGVKPIVPERRFIPKRIR